MFWVLQENKFVDNRLGDILSTLRRFGISHQAVSLSADGVLWPEVDVDGPVITNGTVMLSKLAFQRSWHPGSLLNDNFSFGMCKEHYADRLLNRDAVLTTVRDATPDIPSLFVRPLLDDKTFTGRLTSLVNFKAWQARVVQGADRSVSPDTPILYAAPKIVGQEHRHYIVDGEVVTSSRYKLGGHPNQGGVVDEAIVAFARDTAALWQPARAFVLDTYVTGNEIGVVEIGCICHAGLYQADVQRLVLALDAIPM